MSSVVCLRTGAFTLAKCAAVKVHSLFFASQRRVAISHSCVLGFDSALVTAHLKNRTHERYVLHFGRAIKFELIPHRILAELATPYFRRDSTVNRCS